MGIDFMGVDIGGYMPGSTTAKIIPRPFKSTRKRAWLPVCSTLSNERIWFKHYWNVESYQVTGAGAAGIAWITKTQLLTDEEYCLFCLSVT